MTEKRDLLYDDVIEELKNYGITGAQVYLIDLIPLIEMIWADGKAQGEEVKLLADYLKKHVKHINDIAGYKALSMDEAMAFVKKFLKTRPDPELMATLRSFIAPVRLNSSDPDKSEKLKESLLAACLDIASSSVLDNPHGLHDRFTSDEKRCFFEIMQSLSD
jgi:hypothetical protein